MHKISIAKKINREYEGERVNTLYFIQSIFENQIRRLFGGGLISILQSIHITCLNLIS